MVSKIPDGFAQHQSYLTPLNPDAAGKLVAKLVAAGNRLVHFPTRGRPVRNSGAREITIVRPYIIRYRIDGETIVILRIRHTARRPTRP